MSKISATTCASEGYSGVENLEVMREAMRYNAFLTDLVRKTLPVTGSILDFGAGNGTFARALSHLGHAPICVEPDIGLRQRLVQGGFQAHASVEAVPASSLDGAYTLNVLEHIDDDQGALSALVSRLKPGAPLLAYVPAFPILFTAMDTNVGHVRRYMLPELVARMQSAGLNIERSEYVDSLGFFATLAYRWWGDAEGRVNRRALVAYDRFVFPVSRVVDIVCRRWFGKNLLVIGRRTR